jgi:hypothetical protein
MFSLLEVRGNDFYVPSKSDEGQLRFLMSTGFTPYGVYSKSAVENVLSNACIVLSVDHDEQEEIIRGIICFAILSSLNEEMAYGTETSVIQFQFREGTVKVAGVDFLSSVFPSGFQPADLRFFTRAFPRLTKSLLTGASAQWKEYGVDPLERFFLLYSL